MLCFLLGDEGILMISAVRAACGLITCGLLLAACAGASTNEKPLVLSPGVNIMLQLYLMGEQQGRSALAVNEGGTHTFETYCRTACNGQYNISQEAIKGCERHHRGRCVILAANGRAKQTYTVAGGSIGGLPPQGVAANYVSGDRIRQELAGNSIVEATSEGKVWAEYFAPDGTLRGRTDDGRRFDGLWTIEGKTLCVDYRSIARDWCGEFVEGADGSIDYYREGKFRKNYPRSILQKGNPQNL
jgi:hypothetical protein